MNSVSTLGVSTSGLIHQLAMPDLGRLWQPRYLRGAQHTSAVTLQLRCSAGVCCCVIELIHLLVKKKIFYPKDYCYINV